MFAGLQTSLASLGLILLIGGFLLWRSSSVRRKLSQQDPFQETQAELLRRKKTPEALIHDLEIRLFDFQRSVEGRTETTLRVLDQLLIDAQNESARLEKLLESSSLKNSESDQIDAAFPLEKTGNHEKKPIPDRQRLMLLVLAGLSDQEICRFLNCPSELVRKIRLEMRGDSEENSSAA